MNKIADINEVRRMKRRKEIEAQYVKFYGNMQAKAAAK